MGIEFNIIKDMATISVTIAELSAVNAHVSDEIQSPAFHQEYSALLVDILNTYEIVVATLSPLTSLNSQMSFDDCFQTYTDAYNQSYQSALSEPRINAEFTFEKYLQFRKLKETRTSYPPLKRSFARLHDFIDKWIDNDIWLALTIDSLLKQLFRFLGDVTQLQKTDAEMAFQLYTSCIGSLAPYLAMIELKLGQLKPASNDAHAGITAQSY